MGLPQATSSGIVEEMAASLSPQTFAQNLPRAIGISTRDLKAETNGFTTQRNMQAVAMPVQRVGFESRTTSSTVATNLEESENAGRGSIVRKSLLSPLSKMLLSDQFSGKGLEIGVGASNGDCHGKNDNGEVLFLHENKKAHVGGFIGSKNSPKGHFCKDYFVDDLLFEKDNPKCCSDLPTLLPRKNLSRDKAEEKLTDRAIATPVKKTISSSLTLSPLGSKCTDRRNISGQCSSFMERWDDGYITLEDIEKSLEDSQFKVKSLDDVGKFPRLSRALSGLPIRRSLIGSFEESLLSGHLLSGKVSQRINGFLAVLNILGADLSPKLWKLPFSVTSVEGDNYLFYYSSIHLLGNAPSSKCRGPKIKRRESTDGEDDSHAEKTRLRIPKKGRIQLVLSNPEKTPIHTFLCDYDLSDMLADTKTFPRQKTVLASSVPQTTLQKRKNEDLEMKTEYDPSHILRLKSLISPTINGGGALRYALHLRFLCASSKRDSMSSRGSKCVSFSKAEAKNSNSEKERRFYMYSNMKVVFPQRHSDSDEGKLKVEYDYPSEPKYFDIAY